MVWGPPRCVWARESTAPAQGNQSLSRELRASALCPGLEARIPARQREERGCGPVTGKDRASWQDEALARDGVSREVPCSTLKGEKVPDSLHATPKSPVTRRVPSRGTRRVPAPLPLSPSSPPDRHRRGDSPAWSGRGSWPSRRTSGGGRSHEEIRDEPRGWGHMPNAPDSPVRP